MNHSLLIELQAEELPPKALSSLSGAFAQGIFNSLSQQGLLGSSSQVTPFATPRRLAVHISDVSAKASDKHIQVKLMPVSVGLDAQGKATPALLKKIQTLGMDAQQVPLLEQKMDGKAMALFIEQVQIGVTIQQGLQVALDHSISHLPIPKLMTYQLDQDCAMPGWDSVSFVRPVHHLVALWGEQVLAVKALGLTADRKTLGHRFEAKAASIDISHADNYEQTLLEQGAVIASFNKRKALIQQQLLEVAQAAGEGLKPIQDEALLMEVTGLVEKPNVLLCQFEKAFLEVPPECLVLTMKANQKYFPLLNAKDELTHQFLVVSNITPHDPSAVITGNERVVRPRLADAQFFFNQDRQHTLASRLDRLAKVVYHNQLGTQQQRMMRVSAMVQQLSTALSTAQEQTDALTAAQLAKTDLLTDMVGEFPDLQGIMGAYYALNDGHSQQVAQAIEDHYKPRFAGDSLPRSDLGCLLALADKLETLTGMFGIGNLPTGDKDPYALRRQALGVIRILLRYPFEAMHLDHLLDAGLAVLAKECEIDADKAKTELYQFILDRFAVNLKDQGYSAFEVDAVLALHPQCLGDVPARMEAVRAFAAMPQAEALAAANKRIGNILKKAPKADTSQFSSAQLTLPAEKNLHQAMEQSVKQADAFYAQKNYTDSLKALAALRETVDAFFNDVMVNDPDEDVRRNRLGLLCQLHGSMNRVADLSRLAN
jgi:glycyl-tRNA synthetase beta chain